MSTSGSTIEGAERLAPAMGPPQRHRGPGGRLGLAEFIIALRDNAISIYPQPAFERDVGMRQVAFQRFVLLNRPDLIEHVLVKHPERYGKGRLNRQVLGPVLGRGLLTAEGDFWRRQRRIAAPAFHHKRLAQLADIMVECGLALSRRWAEPGPGVKVDVAREMMAVTMEIVARTLFSRDISDSVDSLGRAITILLDTVGRPSLLDLLGLPEWLPRRRKPEMIHAKRYVERTIRDILEQRRADPVARHDLLAMLLAARDEETGEGMTDRQLNDEIITLFAAGHETTAQALTWTFYLLAQHPEVEAGFHAELDQVLAGRPPGFGDLGGLVYTRQILEESMRLYPPAFSMNRVALVDDRIDGVAIPKGTLVTLSPYVTHRNPKLWPEPERFDPERFAPDQVKARPKYAYFPFGGGPRVCIGNSFAMMEGRLLLAIVGQRFRLRLVPGQRIEPQGRVTLRPRHGLRMTIEPRALSDQVESAPV